MEKDNTTFKSTFPPEGTYIELPWAIFRYAREGLFGDLQEGDISLLVLLIITGLAEEHQACDWTDSQIGEELGLPAEEVARHIAKLKKLGLIKEMTDADGERLLVHKSRPATPKGTQTGGGL